MKKLWRLTLAPLMTATVKASRRRAFRLRGLAVAEEVTATARKAGLELFWPVFKKMELTRVGLLAYGSKL